jgi:ADP-heptose:LPS heptosyltransferase
MIGPDEVERFGDGYIRRLGTSAPVVCEESVDKAADLVCGARVYIGHDAGMTHAAALAGVRTLAIFGPTDPRVWRPLGHDCKVVGFPVADRLDEWVDDLRRRVGLPEPLGFTRQHLQNV